MSRDELVAKYILIDKQIKLVGEKQRQLRELKDTISDQLVALGIPNESGLKVVTKNEYQGLTFGYLEESLNKIVSDPGKVRQIVQFIRNNRTIQTSQEIQVLQAKPT